MTGRHGYKDVPACVQVRKVHPEYVTQELIIDPQGYSEEPLCSASYGQGSYFPILMPTKAHMGGSQANRTDKLEGT